jgi:TPP-dependent trihydroxycyclohexane-1,2-dione (THcHDO) dehydratase
MSLHKRVQDRELIEMIDDGCCLSLHQPLASLLVAGIKVYVLLKLQLSLL